MTIDCIAIAVGFVMVAVLCAVAYWLSNKNRIQEAVETLMAGWVAILAATIVWGIAMQMNEQGLGEIRQLSVIVGVSIFRITRIMLSAFARMPRPVYIDFEE